MFNKLGKMYQCENCGKTFKSETDKVDHEEICKGKLVEFKCGFCGKKITYYESKKYNYQEEIKKNQCHILKINRTGYGSSFEDREIEKRICDECSMLLDKAAIYCDG